MESTSKSYGEYEDKFNIHVSTHNSKECHKYCSSKAEKIEEKTALCFNFQLK